MSNKNKLKRPPQQGAPNGAQQTNRLPSLNLPTAAPAGEAAPEEEIIYEEILEEGATGTVEQDPVGAALAKAGVSSDASEEDEYEDEEGEEETEEDAAAPVGPRPASSVPAKGTAKAPGSPAKRVVFKKATNEQAHAGQIFRARQDILKLLQRVANLEQENANLKKDNAELHIAQIQAQANMIGAANQTMFAQAGLVEGDQLTDTMEGRKGQWVVIPKA